MWAPCWGAKCREADQSIGPTDALMRRPWGWRLLQARSERTGLPSHARSSSSPWEGFSQAHSGAGLRRRRRAPRTGGDVRDGEIAQTSRPKRRPKSRFSTTSPLIRSWSIPVAASSISLFFRGGGHPGIPVPAPPSQARARSAPDYHALRDIGVIQIKRTHEYAIDKQGALHGRRARIADDGG